ncbi:MAG: molybdopterin molybdotransferase MoeA [Nitrososphaerota archaeon]|jgi:molybdopterin molybdotransferase|nr:molybdopterin molybdotransferase MoeA [Nitrososphaerota archaeon]
MTQQEMGRYLKLLPYDEALQKMESLLREHPIGMEEIPVHLSLGRICCKTIRSTIDMPQQLTSAMDGFGVRSDLTARASSGNPVTFELLDFNDSRSSRLKILPGKSVKLSTGAVVPPGVDAVIRREEARIVDGRLFVQRPIQKWKNIERIGDDFSKGSVLVRNGERLTPSMISVLISIGLKTVLVRRRLQVGILSIGREVRTINDDKKKGTVNNFAHMLAGYVSELSGQPMIIGSCPDDPKELKKILAKSAGRFDALITIGRSSVGDEDIVVDVLSELSGASIIFHGLRLLPTRPTGLALLQGKPICILPARAVSAALSFFEVAVPVFNLLEGVGLQERPPKILATSERTFENVRPIECAFLVRVRNEGGSTTIYPLRWGSNLSFELVRANGFVRVPAKTVVEKGAQIEVSLMTGVPNI